LNPCSTHNTQKTKQQQLNRASSYIRRFFCLKREILAGSSIEHRLEEFLHQPGHKGCGVVLDGIPMAWHGMTPFSVLLQAEEIYTIYTDIGRHWDAIYWSDIRRNKLLRKNNSKNFKGKICSTELID
jgi:hypothetical protein